jgi:hypothetical protein
MPTPGEQVICHVENSAFLEIDAAVISIFRRFFVVLMQMSMKSKFDRGA